MTQKDKEQSSGSMFDSPVVGSGSDFRDFLDAARNAFVSCVMGFAAPSTSGLVREKFCQKADVCLGRVW
jgi:hypothetical protein